ncbi:MAG TPA: small multi-drug export protein [bacterium]|nr:small multi-drug export protein [bacterium]
MQFQEMFRGLPPEMATILTAMIPIGELRASIPIAIKIYQMPVLSAFVFSLIGNMIPVPFILLFIDKVSQFLMKRSPLFERFFNWLFERTRKKFAAQYEKYELLALAVFVGIPLPVTGAWTGALAAYLFNIPPKKAFWSIGLGVLMAGVIVTLVSLGFFSFLDFLLKV